MPRNNMNWTPEEDGRMLQCVADGKSVALIAKQLQRTESAVSSRTRLVKNRTDLRNRADADANPSKAAVNFSRPQPEPETELGGGDICSVEWKPSDSDDKPL
jgi:transposase-like protein